jgi:hypothetical protein
MNELLQFLSQDLFTKVVGSAGLLAAAASLLSTVVGFAVHWIVARQKLRASEEVKFKEALESSDLVKLGEYLSTALGQFTIQEYSSRKQVAQRVDRMFDRLADFVAEPEVVQPPPDVEPPAALARELPPLSGDFARVRVDFENEEVWNGLARLRRIIEIRLRQLAIDRGFKEKHLRSAGQMLRFLTDREYVPGHIAQLLQYAIRVCNEGVHGNAVSLDDALAALLAAVEALAGLEQLDHRRSDA